MIPPIGIVGIAIRGIRLWWLVFDSCHGRVMQNQQNLYS